MRRVVAGIIWTALLLTDRPGTDRFPSSLASTLEYAYLGPGCGKQDGRPLGGEEWPDAWPELPRVAAGRTYELRQR